MRRAQGTHESMPARFEILLIRFVLSARCLRRARDAASEPRTAGLRGVAKRAHNAAPAAARTCTS